MMQRLTDMPLKMETGARVEVVQRTQVILSEDMLSRARIR
jgi:hypothetical protein